MANTHPPASRRSTRHTVDATGMCIVLVEWSIEDGAEEEFLAYWSERESIADRSGLIGEFLSRVGHKDEHPWVTWDVATDCITYVNVAMWRDVRAFEDQIVPKMRDDAPLLPFEKRRRRRTVLDPRRWRVGGTSLPTTRHRLVA